MSGDHIASDDDERHDALLAELRELAGLCDPVPPDAVAAARSALAWRTIDAELAELVADSSVDRDLAVVRSAGAATLLTFESAGLTVEVEVVARAETRRLVGQLIPSGPGTVDVSHRHGTVSVVADEVGRFRADDIVPGPVRVRCAIGGLVVVTDWFLA
jgi:hypothetical protein